MQVLRWRFLAAICLVSLLWFATAGEVFSGCTGGTLGCSDTCAGMADPSDCGMGKCTYTMANYLSCGGCGCKENTALPGPDRPACICGTSGVADPGDPV